MKQIVSTINLMVFSIFFVGVEAVSVEQIHLSFSGSNTSMAVDFVSFTETLVIDYQAKSDPSTVQSLNTKSQFKDNIGWLHCAEMSDLSPDMQGNVEYRIRDESDGSFSDWVTFQALPFSRDPAPVAAVFADFGINNDVSMKHIQADAQNGDIDFALHAGDFAYDLNSENSETGNRFMNEASNFSKSIPYMGCVGNHERHENFTQFTRRFQGLADFTGNRSGSGNSFFYSFDVHSVHYVIIDTENYLYTDETANSDFPFSPEDQLDWLRADLERANKNRDNVPWIVMMGHKGWYMDALGDFPIQGSATTNFTGFDDLACEYGVDLYLTGHVHLYQRFLPTLGPDNVHFMARPRDVDHDCVSEDGHMYTNPRQMVTIVVGSPGDQEINPRPLCTALDLASAIRWDGAQVLCSADYGYGHLQAINSTHMYWEFLQTGRSPGLYEWKNSVYGKPFPKPLIRDYLWIVQENHAPRSTCS